MRIVPALALVLLAAVPSQAAPRGVTFTDVAGDANGLDGANGTGSQASFDILKVRLSPYRLTKDSSGITVRVDLAAAPTVAPGLSYVFSANQYGCDITITHTVSADGTAASAMQACGTSGGGYHTGNDFGGLVIAGRTVTFNVPAGLLMEDAPGSGLTKVEVSTAAGEPGSGAITPAELDLARYPKTYHLGS